MVAIFDYTIVGGNTMREMTSFKNVYNMDNRINQVVFLKKVEYSYYTNSE
jgi:hypothetical protein